MSDDKQNPDPPEFDRRTLHKAMKAAKGNQSEAHRMLREAGCEHTMKWLNDRLHKDPVLKAVWIDGNHDFSAHEAPSQNSPVTEKQLEQQLIQAENEYIEREAVEKVFSGDAAEALAFADFAGKAFARSINIVHGLAVADVMRLHKRAESIEIHILECDEIVTHKGVDNEGNYYEYEGPKYSQDQKLEWQRQYTDIMTVLAKFQSNATAAAEAKIKAHKLRHRDPKDPGKSGRGKRDWIEAD